VVICLERDADLHMAQLMPLPLTVSCFSKTQIGFTFLVPDHLGSPGKGPLNGCVCVCVFSWELRAADFGCLLINTVIPRILIESHIFQFSWYYRIGMLLW